MNNCPITAKLSDEEIEVLIQYKNENGPRWKSKLNDDWMYARLRGPIHQLRNVSYFGPSGLAKVKNEAIMARWSNIIDTVAGL